MSDGVVVCDAEGRVMQCSEHAAELVGRPADVITGRGLCEVLQPCLRADGRVVPSHRPIWFRSDRSPFVRGITRPDGSLQWVRLDLHRLGDSSDEAPVLLILTHTSYPFLDLAGGANHSATNHREAGRGESDLSAADPSAADPSATDASAADPSGEADAFPHDAGRFRSRLRRAPGEGLAQGSRDDDVAQTVGMYRSTPHQGVIAVDAGMVNLFGYPARTLRVIDAEQLLVNPAEAEALRAKRRTNGGLRREEVHFRRCDGVSFWGLLNSICVRDDDGDVLYYDNIIVDITDLKETQLALQASEELYRVLAENSVDIITRHALDSTYHYVSPAVEPVLGYSPEEMMGRRAIDITHPDDLGIYRQISKAADDDARIKERARFRHKHGHYVWLEVTGRLIRDPSSDRSIEYVASSRDVTVQVNSENVLRATAQRLRILSDISQTTLQTTDLETVGQVALDTLARAIPQFRASILAFDEAAGHAEVLAVRTDGATEIDEGTRLPLTWLHTFDALRRGLDGRVTDLDSLNTSSPLLKRLKEMGIQSFISVPAVVEDRTVGALNIAHDEPDAFTSDHIAMAREVARLIALAMRQKQYQDDLVEAKEEAEEMSRLKSAFLANMSHEIRTPLTAILGFSDVLAAEAEAPHDDIARLISRSGHRLMETLDSVLQLSRLEAGNMELAPEPVDVIEEVREVAALMQPRADDEEVRLITDLPSHPVEGRFDAMALFRVLSNLVSNAIKFTERDGTVTLTVRTSPEEPPVASGPERSRDGGRVEIIVADTGIGMNPAMIPELFGAFRQESTGTRRSHEGSGLGLTIVRRLVDLMHGTIDVESTKGEGSTFSIHLPLNPPPATGETTESSVDIP
jgi:PAS domain S-box-containing protein